ncbi:MAG: ABC transporter permease [Dehalococcoidia bacterium]
MILKTLLRRKTRTFLTVVGIAIGVAAVVALGAIAEGMVAQLTGMLTKGGADLTVMQANIADMSLSAIDDDVGRRIAAMPAVKSVSGMIMSVIPAKGMPYFLIFGYDPKEYAIKHFKIIEGEKLTSGRRRQIIIGSMAADNLKKGVGDTIRVFESAYRIVGIYETGVPYEEGGGVIALKEAQAIFRKPRQVGFYEVKLKRIDRAEEVIEEIERRFPQVSVSKSAEFAERTPDIQTMRSIIPVLSSIAIIVGGVGMMNTMLMSVFERTREIGVFRALGWRRGRILWMILRESLALGLMGGLLGIVLGVGMIKAIERLPAVSSLLRGMFSLSLFAQALLIALALGAIGGLYPAWRASKLKPIEALRYE